MPRICRNALLTNADDTAGRSAVVLGPFQPSERLVSIQFAPVSYNGSNAAVARLFLAWSGSKLATFADCLASLSARGGAPVVSSDYIDEVTGSSVGASSNSGAILAKPGTQVVSVPSSLQIPVGANYLVCVLDVLGATVPGGSTTGNVSIVTEK